LTYLGYFVNIIGSGFSGHINSRKVDQLKKARKKPKKKRIKLAGFNNLTKTLSFNIYDICYAATAHARKEYLEYIDEEYNSKRLKKIMHDVADIVGATILNTSTQDYDPMGASVTMLISEDPNNCPLPNTQLAHLDKSHICSHTYPESNKRTGISTFRVDIDVSTCGEVSPLKALNHLISNFESDVVLIDYKVRGFTRDTKGRKLFIDHKILSIQEFINKKLLKHYRTIDFNIYQENLFHTKMILNEFNLDDYLFGSASGDLSEEGKEAVSTMLEHEMTEIFYSKNIYPARNMR